MNTITLPKTSKTHEANKASSTLPACGSCHFYVDGYCQRFPPVVVAYSGALQGRWPGVGVNDWCGEYK